MGQTKQKCTAMVYPKEAYGSFHGYHCSRYSVVEREGKGFCKQHDPVRMKKLHDESYSKYRKEADARMAQQERERACINALAGIEDPAKFVREAKAIEKQRNELIAFLGVTEEQRNALLEAGKTFLRGIDECNGELEAVGEKAFRAAIAKAREKA